MFTSLARGADRCSRFFAVSLLASFLSACGGVSSNMLPAENASSTAFTSYEAVEAAYDKVNVGETNAQALAQLGFDVKTEPNVEKLSYYTVMQRFMPESSIRFETLAPPVQTCINAQERCSALVFHPTKLHYQRNGGVATDLLGFERNSTYTGWSAEVVFLMNDGTVVYKVLQGKPRTRLGQDLVQPLGPLTNLGDTVVRVGKGFGGKF